MEQSFFMEVITLNMCGHGNPEAFIEQKHNSTVSCASEGVSRTRN